MLRALFRRLPPQSSCTGCTDCTVGFSCLADSASLRVHGPSIQHPHTKRGAPRAHSRAAVHASPQRGRIPLCAASHAHFIACWLLQIMLAEWGPNSCDRHLQHQWAMTGLGRQPGSSSWAALCTLELPGSQSLHMSPCQTRRCDVHVHDSCWPLVAAPSYGHA
ncbi:hypothetical protein IQ07DRAFT_281967 [Pyrenochaeta sp. DS3sAY3a]|nr:hypothetical protein IQ07DRAFT_281967 [Pyrenochaeta sp. DS3sAY3a]